MAVPFWTWSKSTLLKPYTDMFLGEALIHRRKSESTVPIHRSGIPPSKAPKRKGRRWILRPKWNAKSDASIDSVAWPKAGHEAEMAEARSA